MRLATCRVGLVSPRSTWLSIGAETPERSARSRSERSIASRRAFTRGPTAATVGSAAVAITAVRYHVQACPTLERVQLPDALVLGAGGTLGEAWLRGVLNGLEAGAGLDFRDCEYLLGTSAGSIVAASLAGGRRPEAGDRAAAEWARNVPDSVEAAPEEAAFLAPVGRAAKALATPFASVALSVSAPAGRLARAALLSRAPRPQRRLDGVGRFVEQLGARFDGRLRIAAVDRRSGRRVMFGAPRGPHDTPPPAPLAACALPSEFPHRAHRH